ncbi:MAG: hypothetical protein ACFFEF_08005 [Candidatus Thorarchaeota archaeon]
MQVRDTRVEIPNPTELDVIRSFAWAIVELESILFERYTHLSMSHSLTTIDDFRKILRRMESKGFLASVDLHGKRAFKKLLIDKRVQEITAPRNPNEEMKLALASRRVKQKEEPDFPTKVTSELITQSEATGEEIIKGIEELLARQTKAGKIDKIAAARHIENMRIALNKSEEDLIRYIRKETPQILHRVQSILHYKGPDYLLLSLRMAEAQVRKYK